MSDTITMTKEQLQEAMKEVLQGLPNIQTPPAIMQGDTITLKEYGGEFMENKSRTVAKTTQSKNGFLYRKHILPALGDQTLASITRSQVQTFINRMADQSYSMETIKATKCLLSAIMELAASDRLIPANPCKAVKLPKVEKKKKRAPTVEEFKRLLRVSAGHRLWITVPLLFLAGLRIGEMLALTWDDIDMKERLIYVSKTLSTENGSGKAYLKDSPKTKAGHRRIPICDELFVMLKRYREQQGKGRHIVIPKQDEDAYTHPQVFRGKVFKYWCYAADLPKDITPHSGRHYFAYRLYAAGVNPETLRHFTGHSDISTLLDVYCHTDKLSDETMIQARSMMNVLCG